MIKVYSKIELSKDLKEKILNSLRTKKKIDTTDAEFLIDESIISGVKIDIDSEVIDLTVNSRLEKILNIMK